MLRPRPASRKRASNRFKGRRLQTAPRGTSSGLRMLEQPEYLLWIPVQESLAVSGPGHSPENASPTTATAVRVPSAIDASSSSTSRVLAETPKFAFFTDLKLQRSRKLSKGFSLRWAASPAQDSEPDTSLHNRPSPVFSDTNTDGVGPTPSSVADDLSSASTSAQPSAQTSRRSSVSAARSGTIDEARCVCGTAPTGYGLLL